MRKRKLPTVTLLGVDCVDIKRLSLAAKICQEQFEFADVKLLTSLPAKNEKGIVRIPPLRSTEAYSQFALQEFNRYVETPHVLIIQYDGFILNPKAWTDEFLKYDYIGAPWLVKDWSVKDFGFPKKLLGKLVVGNGGFCLRSKRFLELSERLARRKNFKFHPEDVVLCVRNRTYLEKHGMLFAPAKLAKQFSFEGENDEGTFWNGQFGFHGIRWTDISKWVRKNPRYKVDPKKNTITYSRQKPK